MTLPSRKLWVAVDVKGTLMGNNAERVTAFVKWLAAQGHNIVVWSNLYSYAMEAAAALKPDVVAGVQSKRSRHDGENGVTFDLAIDDEVRSQAHYLAADNFLWSQDVPADPAEYEAFLKTAIPLKDIEP